MAVTTRFQRRSGRVISLGRLMLATLFLAAVFMDASQPAQAATETYALLIVYVLLALAITLFTWDNWWLDAKLAAPAHVLDVAVFTALVLSTDGYTSPFFLLFVFLLLSAAIRWGWRETAATAAVVIILYLTAGMIAAQGAGFELQRFFVRSGQLIILSALMIWFGANEGASTAPLMSDDFDPAATLDESPFETALRHAMRVTGGRRGLLVWRPKQGEEFAISIRDGLLAGGKPPAETARLLLRGKPLLFDIAKRRGLCLKRKGRYDFSRADWDSPQGLHLSQGLAFPIRADTGEGEIYLQDVDSLSTDHLQLAPHLASQCKALIQRHALLRAVDEGAEARARLVLARDLHDSIVQFLTGTAFKLEGSMRAARRGVDIEPRLRELKDLVLEEQGEMRKFIGVLRHGRQIPVREVADEIRELASKLSRQWNAECTLDSVLSDTTVPMRLYLDVQHLVREGVANAVRHGDAHSIAIRLSFEDGALQLQMIDDGRGLPPGMTGSTEGHAAGPRSLKERIEHAGGQLTLASSPGTTTVSISLPIDGPEL